MEHARALFEAGGWAMYPLLALSVLSVAMTIERTLFWLRTHGRARPAWIQRVARAARERDDAKLRSLLKKDRTLYARFASPLLESDDTTKNPAVLDARLREGVELVRSGVERFSGSMNAIITGAPMLGILGTVTGIIRSFRVLGDATIQDPTAVAGGIAEALLTTAFGLIIALATLFPYVVFRAQAQRCFDRLEVVGSAIMASGKSRRNETESTDT
ncbi:MAG: MotA/TolQ/ExbB proton channel family protein [Phycisphaerales bacterium JB037]